MKRPAIKEFFKFELKLLRATCISLLGSQISVLAATLPLASNAPAAAGQTQSAEAIAKIAQAITVRIEGATQGSGVIIKRDGKRYTVLTAWHVVSGQRPGEELAIYTIDGRPHKVLPKSINRVKQIDMAELTFTSEIKYQSARIGDPRLAKTGGEIYVTGYPIATSAVPVRLPRFLKGHIIAFSTHSLPGGYQILYSNPTLPGMSGGAVLNYSGHLIGIHGKAEIDELLSDSTGIAIKTGTNQAIPITHYASSVDTSTQADRSIGIQSPNKSKRDVLNSRNKILDTSTQREILSNELSHTRTQGDQDKLEKTIKSSIPLVADPACELRLSLGYRC